MTRLCALGDLAEGDIVRVDLPSRTSIAVYNVEGVFYATDNLCTHEDAVLSDGLIDDDLVECPLHGGTFRIATGEAVDLPCRLPLRVYPVEVAEGAIWADLGEG